MFDENGSHIHTHDSNKKRYSIKETLEILDLEELPFEDIIQYLPCEEKVSNIMPHIIESMNMYH